MKAKLLMGLMVLTASLGIASAQTATPNPGVTPPAREGSATQQRARLRTNDGTCDPAGQSGQRIRKGNRSGATQGIPGTGSSQNRGRRGGRS